MRYLTAVAALGLVLAVTATARATTVDLSVEPAGRSVLVGEAFDMELWARSADAGTSLMGILAELSWNPDKLDLLGYTGEIVGLSTFFALSTGEARLDGAMLEGTVQTDVLVYTLEFEALEGGSTPLRLRHAIVRDGANKDITGSLFHADITIAEPATPIPEPVTMAGLVLGIGSLVGYVRRRR